MPTIKAQAEDGKFLNIQVDPNTDPSQYDGIVEDALQHYNGGVKAQLKQQDQPSLASKTQSFGSGMLDGIVDLGKKVHTDYNMLADMFSDPSSPLYDEAVAATLRGLPGAVGVPESKLGVALSVLGGASELGATKPLTQAIETGGKKLAQGVFQLGGMPASKASGASKNLEQIANPENIGILRQAYNNVMGRFGIKPLEDVVASKYPAATGALQKAVNNYTGELGEKIVTGTPLQETDPQELHNVIDAVSKRLDNPWAYPGPENARAVPAATMKDLYQMKQDAMDKLAQWADSKVDMLKEATSSEALSAMDPAHAKAVQDAAPNLIAQAQSDAEAIKQVSNLRKQIFLAKTSASMNRLTPPNLNGSMNQLGTMAQLGGAAQAVGSIATGNPSLAAVGAAVAAAKSPIVGKGLVLGTRAAYNSLPLADQSAQLFNAGLSQEDEDLANGK